MAEQVCSAQKESECTRLPNAVVDKKGKVITVKPTKNKRGTSMLGR